MVSEFCATHGRLHCVRDTKVYATEIIKYGGGRSDDGWWNAEKMVIQVTKAVDIFNKACPGDVAAFTFKLMIPADMRAKAEMPIEWPFGREATCHAEYKMGGRDWTSMVFLDAIEITTRTREQAQGNEEDT